MYQKLNQNRLLKIFLSSVAVAMLFGFVIALPLDQVQAQNVSGFNALGSFFGGRILYFVPGYPWTTGSISGYCPPHMVILSYGAPYRGQMAITVPPAAPKSFYNYYTPLAAVTGSFWPVPLIWPIPLSCPDTVGIPTFLGVLGGTSAGPSIVQ